MADLITLERALYALPSDISSADQLTVPTLIAAASRACERWCNRSFTAADYDETRTPSPAPQFTAQADMVQLRNFPLNSVARVAGGRTAALLIANTATSTNQRATAEVAMTGDPDAILTATGLTLIRVASAVPYTSSLTFAAYPTLSALAAAIDALGSGWTATVQSGLGSWPSSELVSREGPLGCLSVGCTLDVFSSDMQLIDVDRRGGVVYFSSYGPGPSGSTGWGGDILGSDADVTYGSFRPQVRVRYNAGWSAIPDDVQLACANAVQVMFANQTSDPRFKSVTLGDKSFTLGDTNPQLPDSAKVLLAPYRVRSC